MNDIEKAQDTPLDEQNASENKLKTWLVKAVIRHPDPDGGASWADHIQYYPVEASNAKQARQLVMRWHCPEADEGRGKWGYMHGAEGGAALRAFYLKMWLRWMSDAVTPSSGSSRFQAMSTRS